MKNFIVGVVVTLIVLAGGVYLFLRMGLLAVNADAQPGGLERSLANMSLDASVSRNAPGGPNPVSSTEATLRNGVKLYKGNCAECHGGPDGPSQFGLSFYPRAPQFVKRRKPFDDPDPNLFYVIKHGIRLTGMPAFGAARQPLLKDEEIWTLVDFIKQFPDVPASIQADWKAKAAEPAPLDKT